MPESGPRSSELLAAVVAGISGRERPGQLRMAEAVEAAFRDRRHLLVQAGTGTGKSFGYLVPAALTAIRTGRCVIIATATLALQAQLVHRDLPALAAAAQRHLHRPITFATVMGRSNYACLHRVRDGAPEETEPLIDGGTIPALAQDVLRARAWALSQADEGGSGLREHLTPGVADRAWSLVSVSAAECLGASRCPYGQECFAEQAKARAGDVDIVVTNHALLAIQVLDGLPVLPDHCAVVIDEAHELVARTTGIASAELHPTMIDRAARRLRGKVDEGAVDRLADAAALLSAAFADEPSGRMDRLSTELAEALDQVRSAARRALSSLAAGQDSMPTLDGRTPGGSEEAARRQAKAGLDALFAVADRCLSPGALPGGPSTQADVAWIEERPRGGKILRIAPLSVSALLASRLFARTVVVMTSATLQVGGRFDALARSVGLPPPAGAERGSPRREPSHREPSHREPGASEPGASEPGASEPSERSVVAGHGRESHREGSEPPSDAAKESPSNPLAWTGLDVGSPFDYSRQAMLYVARHLSVPGRDGPHGQLLDEIRLLVDAAGGRTLGLFSSRRAAEIAAEHVRSALPNVEVLCQGDDLVPVLVRRFIAGHRCCLFGTLTLWQGVDVPGSACHLVLIDRIPFPRPDDPLASARARVVQERGGDGFMAIAAVQAALLLAQGAGRLVRSSDDRGVVAVLDPRLATARYASLLLETLPPMWRTTDLDLVLAALRRLDVSAKSGGTESDQQRRLPPRRTSQSA